MTQINAGVSFKGRLPQIVGQAALAASVLAGGATVLNAGGAHALICSPNTAAQFTLGDVSVISGPAPLNCEIVSAGSNIASVDIDYASINTPGTGSYAYKLSAAGPFNIFNRVSMNVDAGGLSPDLKVTKTLYSDAGLTTVIGSIMSTNGVPVFDTAISIPTLSPIWVKDEWTLGSNTTLNSISNTFNAVPGPLPILGAGAAFGFSRKLRSRIKAGRTA